MKNRAVSIVSFLEPGEGVGDKKNFVLSTIEIHGTDDVGGETRKGMNADGTGKVFDGLWDREHVEGRLYNFP